MKKPIIKSDKNITLSVTEQTIDNLQPLVSPNIQNIQNIQNIKSLQSIIQKTIRSAQKYKLLDVFGSNELNICITSLENIFIALQLLTEKNNNDYMAQIIAIKNDLLILFKNFGTESFNDLVTILLGDEYITEHFSNTLLTDKFNIIAQCIHPISFKILPWPKGSHNETKTNIATATAKATTTAKATATANTNVSNAVKVMFQSESNKKTTNKSTDDSIIIDTANNLDCYDLARSSKTFQIRVYGIKVVIQDYINKKTIFVSCVVDDILLSCLNYPFLTNKLLILANEYKDVNIVYWNRFIGSLMLKELLIYNNTEITINFQNTMNQLQLIKQKTISQVVKEFVNHELYGQRAMLIQLLIKSNESEFQYLAYLLYDLLSNESNGTVDTLEQTLLYDSMPWAIKKSFKNAMKQTIKYTNALHNYDNNKIPLEQQICLMKVSDTVKEKAILKLKEIKAKTEDSGSKARQYLDGLLKIPFGIVKQEHIMTINSETQMLFKDMISKMSLNSFNTTSNSFKNQYTNIELLAFTQNIKDSHLTNIIAKAIDDFCNAIKCLKKEHTVSINIYINQLIKTSNLNWAKLNYGGKKISVLQDNIIGFIQSYSGNSVIMNKIYTHFTPIIKWVNPYEYITAINDNILLINKNITEVTTYMQDVSKTLDTAIYGHEKAKRQISRIIAQWINGEKTGYCFGFEGAAGCGKTSLAKRGIANCLKDTDGNSRPFAFIAVGGSANGSTLEGHNYTYVGSTWGKIVDILIDTKCMNPIIFIDELDKISKTEHGREIIGILTHLIDATQNDGFQDKYFSGIELDLSKALFIFSYNDVDAIDRILLDRIHRIKFKHLTLKEKLVIAKNYMLPEIYKKMGFDNVVTISDNVIEYIIKTYTNEPGVRKLKEIFFEIMGEINLVLLTGTVTETTITSFPIDLTIDDIRTRYLKNRPEHTVKKIGDKDAIGVISGLWANAVGQGGLLPIEARFLPSTTFLDLKLTGMQGDVMKESMNVARTLAWELLDDAIKTELLNSFEEKKNKCRGAIHIHVPEGATPKDGPSGGAAITTVIYSLLSQQPINKDFAMTGEICLQGKITAIGGLDLKILGGIESGATRFIYPKDNEKDYKEFYDSLDDKSILDNIKFYPVEHITEVLSLIFVTTL